ncbi:MAG TPA: dTDP-4-dehydrorhamnose reductase [Elusimicrobia bacterium]|nr:MAG: dTDP-4-dehydrorhamnose reductase [Elusimicrobia bacterium RIFOXYA12_FULL_49_49]OGS10808.1 MAG: dTDP-4-dehydrorhamnose reductase [Elusimicrobia bacterium RIFOXYB1_FULL_48_9]OGS16824.1 MAG: dTDP-4-dehydrorhamnose reductase [Elusimicrobia bacterium RIFOXYA2_FULL_47_53]OGS32052.1 MAG: dTDP-4-dehydrorhamnose reductase [Elusimicrobia bacterium RIFOXYB2_FULL_46_23]HBU69945.1 dTDP-4-dehydrorhamnose reductase [Elusimicrobiota bacterium]
MKILITGINGMLGTELTGTLEPKHTIIGLDINAASSSRNIIKVDLTDPQSTYEAITKANPDIVIHTAAVTNVDLCETDPDLAYRMNALATRNVALSCQRFDAVMVYISTDYVFSGDDTPEGGYSEFHEVNPVSVYGASKLAGERFVRDLLSKYFIVRTSWLFGSLRANFVTQIADAVTSDGSVKTASDMVSSPTNVRDLSQALARLIETNLYGTYHISNSGYASRYEIGLEIAKMLNGSSEAISKIELKNLNLPAKRPCFSAMRNYVWKLNGFEPLRSWQESVGEFLKEKGYLNA